jgi:hypothetical protein
MTPAVAAALWLAVAAAQDGGAVLFRPLELDHQAVPDKVQLGEPFTYRLVVTHPPDHRYELRVPRELGVFELAQHTRSRKDEDGRAVTTFALQMAAFELGKQRLPDLVFDVVAPDSAGTFETQGAEVEVTSVLSETAIQNGEPLWDIKPPEEVPIPSYRLLWIALGVAAAAVLGFLLYRRLRRPRAAPVLPAPREPLDVRTRRALDELRAQDLPAQGRAREFHFRLSEILRGYLGERYGFDALECTSHELLARLRTLHTPGLSLEALERHVHESDLVKFARAQTTPSQCHADLDLAYQLVLSTTAVLAQPPPPLPADAARPVS